MERSEIIAYLNQRPATTKEVILSFIMPTAKKNVPFITSLKDEFKNQCTDFVSHAWGDNFENLVLALRENAELTPRKRFVYFIDIFCVAQKNNYSNAHYFKEFDRTMNSCKRLLLVMRNLPDSVLLTRSWCVYEIYNAIKLKKSIVVTQTHANWKKYKPEFIKSLMPTSNSINEILYDVTETSHKAYDATIIQKVNDCVTSLERNGLSGFFLLNRILSDRIRDYAQIELRREQQIKLSRTNKRALEYIKRLPPLQFKRFDSAVKLFSADAKERRSSITDLSEVRRRLL
jgi:hypothetical protein